MAWFLILANVGDRNDEDQCRNLQTGKDESASD